MMSDDKAPVKLSSRYRKMLADIYTPVGIYLRLRDRYPGAVLLESSDSHAGKNSYSFIAILPVAGMEINTTVLEYKYPGVEPVRQELDENAGVPACLQSFLKSFKVEGEWPAAVPCGLFGYTAYDAIPFFETLEFRDTPSTARIPLLRYRLYQYVIAIDHFKNELYLCELLAENQESELDLIETLIRNKDCPAYPFDTRGTEGANMSDADYMDLVEKGKKHCYRGDVFQIVPSRSFRQQFAGDEFNVYRALRSINPSPYLFYFDYGDYRLMGSSPESQLIIKNGKVIMHPIAGTVRRTGNDDTDRELADQLLKDPKENAEHVMLVDLARNDLSRHAREVKVDYYREVHYYSHVIHLVSEVSGKLPEGANPFEVLAGTFPAGTLSGAPKYRAMELIDQYEPTSRGFYAGCIGHVGFNGDFNHAIMIRSFLSKDNVLHYQAGAGIVAASVATSELQEVKNKLNALRQALELAKTLGI
ncbi:anthranilate synthase component I family protein [Compostibacter hankyongensis]|uniref:Anthranilate synthase component 1 n=1 Tax=Compostibacter hankyongensis TaxID=1007089 RepID=A0ABP8FX52_9BACT